jgi:hypothetical protein
LTDAKLNAKQPEALEKKIHLLELYKKNAEENRECKCQKNLDAKFRFKIY